jgi:hypothetical protein
MFMIKASDREGGYPHFSLIPSLLHCPWQGLVKSILWE